MVEQTTPKRTFRLPEYARQALLRRHLRDWFSGELREKFPGLVKMLDEPTEGERMLSLLTGAFRERREAEAVEKARVQSEARAIVAEFRKVLKTSRHQKGDPISAAMIILSGRPDLSCRKVAEILGVPVTRLTKNPALRAVLVKLGKTRNGRRAKKGEGRRPRKERGRIRFVDPKKLKDIEAQAE